MKTNELIAATRAAGRVALDEAAGKQVLANLGVSVPKSLIIQDVSGVAKACAGLRPPFALKVVSPDILHKSDAGGVKVGLKNAAEVEDAIRAMMKQPAIANARLDGFLLEEMAPAGQEIVIGGVRDPQFGPMVMVGLGGIFVEVLADVAFRICPITRLDAEEMLDELKGAALLKGARGRKPVSRAAIVDALLKVGGEGGLLMTHGGDIAEADINPLIVSETGAVAVDARFVLTQPPMNADERR
ncbi:MAG TPA: acetate--CoA ligase family protein [Burkholderiales bacterium]|nr:acetate--CoA ligase family protein [Burkholderiales bacterium]